MYRGIAEYCLFTAEAKLVSAENTSGMGRDALEADKRNGKGAGLFLAMARFKNAPVPFSELSMRSVSACSCARRHRPERYLLKRLLK